MDILCKTIENCLAFSKQAHCGLVTNRPACDVDIDRIRLAAEMYPFQRKANRVYK